MPDRITRQRAKGWRKPDGAVIVTRGTIWGNPWGVGAPGTVDLVLDGAKARYKTLIASDALDVMVQYEKWLRDGTVWGVTLPDMTHFTDAGKMAVKDHLAGRRKLILANLDQLRGHDLCCWCKPGEPCHADVLLRLAAGEGF